MTGVNLVQDLPANLDEAVRKSLIPGERLLVSLRGAIGEALVATDGRVGIVREEAPYQSARAYWHALGQVLGVRVGTSTSGGTLEIAVSGSAPEEERRLYYSLIDKPRFEAAAERIEELVSPPQAAVAPTAEPAAPPQQAALCANCGAPVGDRDAFCPSCGTKIADICQVCSGPLRPLAAYCPSCGSEARRALLACPSCEARVNSAYMSNCPQCGVRLVLACAACGAAVIAGWPRCRYCGREIGSDMPLTGRAYRLYREQKQRETEPAAATQQEAEKAGEDAGESPAAQHNAKGAELFDQDKVEEAIEEFRRAAALEPDNSSYHCNLAVAYEEADQTEDARREYERTLELNPNDTTALLYLGYILNEVGERERAADLWRRLTEIAPGTPEAEEAQQSIRAQEEL